MFGVVFKVVEYGLILYRVDQYLLLNVKIGLCVFYVLVVKFGNFSVWKLLVIDCLFSGVIVFQVIVLQMLIGIGVLVFSVFINVWMMNQFMLLWLVLVVVLVFCFYSGCLYLFWYFLNFFYWCGGLWFLMWIEWFMFIYRFLVFCIWKFIEYGCGSEVLCCSRMVLLFLQVSVVVMILLSLNFILVLGWVVLLFLVMVYLCRLCVLVVKVLMWVKWLLWLMLVYIVYGLMLWLGYSLLLCFIECLVCQCVLFQFLGLNFMLLLQGWLGLLELNFMLCRLCWQLVCRCISLLNRFWCIICNVVIMLWWQQMFFSSMYGVLVFSWVFSMFQWFCRVMLVIILQFMVMLVCIVVIVIGVWYFYGVVMIMLLMFFCFSRCFYVLVL